MPDKYRATLKGNCLEWEDDDPPRLIRENAVRVYVTILEESILPLEITERGQRMAAALEQLASINALQDVTDPVEWEREIRQDRILPGRIE